ncbi:MAG TPA: acylphosphatase [Myxococcota bacterium]|nr:acylphosphatase [Myxococcota bacterium]
MRRQHFWVSGSVQGVFFRGATQERMRELGLRGWVRNLADGRVEGVVEGGEPELAQAFEFLRRGPRGARVEGVVVRDEEGGEALGPFEIRR